MRFNLIFESRYLNLSFSSFAWRMEEAVKSQRAIVYFLWKEGSSAAEIVRRLHHVFGDDILGRSAVFKWLERFKTGRQSFEDNQRSGRPKASDDDEKA